MRSDPSTARDPIGAAGLVELAGIDVLPPPSRETDEIRNRLQELTKDLAFNEEHWDDNVRHEILEMFDERAETWDSRADATYRRPLEDALLRGGLEHLDSSLEIGSGTSIQTPTLLGHFSRVISIDISYEMLSRAHRSDAWLLRGDAAQLPVLANSMDAVVCVNAFLFPHRYAEVISPHGAIVFVSTRAELTPIYLAPHDVLSSLNAAQMGEFTATSARVASGCWTVAKRL